MNYILFSGMAIYFFYGIKNSVEGKEEDIRDDDFMASLAEGVDVADRESIPLKTNFPD